EGRGSFFGTLVASDIGRSRLIYVHSTSQHITRKSQRPGQDRDDSFLLKYLIEGLGVTSQHGNLHDIQSGSFFLHDVSSCSTLRLIADFKALTLSVPRKLVDRSFAQPQYLCAVPLQVAHSAVGRVAADMLLSIARNCPQMESEGVESLIESLLQVVALAFGLSR